MLLKNITLKKIIRLLFWGIFVWLVFFLKCVHPLVRVTTDFAWQMVLGNYQESLQEVEEFFSLEGKETQEFPESLEMRIRFQNK